MSEQRMASMLEQCSVHTELPTLEGHGHWEAEGKQGLQQCVYLANTKHQRKKYATTKRGAFGNNNKPDYFI